MVLVLCLSHSPDGDLCEARDAALLSAESPVPSTVPDVQQEAIVLVQSMTNTVNYFSTNMEKDSLFLFFLG